MEPRIVSKEVSMEEDQIAKITNTAYAWSFVYKGESYILYAESPDTDHWTLTLRAFGVPCSMSMSQVCKVECEQHKNMGFADAMEHIQRELSDMFRDVIAASVM